MCSRILILLLGLIALTTASCAQAQPQANATSEPTHTQSEISDLNRLIQSAAIILIAEVDLSAPAQANPPTGPSPDISIDLEKERDKAREAQEETARTFSGLAVGPLVRLKTVETLKGPDTNILSLPATTQELKDAKTGQLFLVFMGVEHPDAIKAISSLNDPWAEQVRAALAN